MKLIAPGVYRFQLLWPYAFNAYFIETADEGVVVDASTRWSWGLMKRQLKNRRVTAMLLTHAHPDHQGCAAKICRRFDVPLACHEAEVDSAEGRAPLVRHNPFFEFMGNAFWSGKRSAVSRRLTEGDEIAGFRVYHLPGHTRGHIALFRESDRVAIAGDVINSNDYLTGMLPMLRESPRMFSANPAQNRESIRRLLSLNPSIICTGHGPPLRRLERLERLVKRLDRKRPRAFLAPSL